MGRRDYTELGGTESAFPATHWSLIDGIQRGEDSEGILIDALLRQYWRPVYCCLRRKGCSNEQAKDLTQGFFHEIVLDQSLVQRADHGKGCFRAFLLHALNHYFINERNRERARKRCPRGRLVSWEGMDFAALPEKVSTMTAEDSYNYAWLCDLLERVLAEVEAECRSDGLELHWTVFRERIVLPVLGDHTSPSARELCERYGIEDEKKVFNMIITVKRRFQAAIRKRVRNTVANEDEVEDEMRELLRYLPQSAQHPEIDAGYVCESQAIICKTPVATKQYRELNTYGHVG